MFYINENEPSDTFYLNKQPFLEPSPIRRNDKSVIYFLTVGKGESPHDLHETSPLLFIKFILNEAKNGHEKSRKKRAMVTFQSNIKKLMLVLANIHNNQS